MNETSPIPWPKRICIDFDGVIHSYTSKWVDPQTISDPPVPGAFKAIQDYIRAGFKVAIFSSRNSKPDAILAMIRWFMEQGLPVPVIEHLEWPVHKPAAEIYIDDRGYHFRGIFPDVGWIEDFRPWNK